MYDKNCSGTIKKSKIVEALETVYLMEGIKLANTFGNNAGDRARQKFPNIDLNR